MTESIDTPFGPPKIISLAEVAEEPSLRPASGTSYPVTRPPLHIVRPDDQIEESQETAALYFFSEKTKFEEKQPSGRTGEDLWNAVQKKAIKPGDHMDVTSLSRDKKTGKPITVGLFYIDSEFDEAPRENPQATVTHIFYSIGLGKAFRTRDIGGWLKRDVTVGDATERKIRALINERQA